MTDRISQKTYEDAYVRAHQERAAVARNAWAWLFSRASR